MSGLDAENGIHMLHLHSVVKICRQMLEQIFDCFLQLSSEDQLLVLALKLIHFGLFSLCFPFRDLGAAVVVVDIDVILD